MASTKKSQKKQAVEVDSNKKWLKQTIQEEQKQIEESNKELELSAQKSHFIQVSNKSLDTIHNDELSKTEKNKNKINFEKLECKMKWKSKSFLFKALIISIVLVVLIIISVFVGLYFAKTYK